MPHIFSVFELTQAIKDTLEGEFPFVWVQGQVGNVARPGSGHIYFTLKDERSCLDIVWFQSNQSGQMNISPARLQTGQDILCAGRLTVYAQRGTYQVLAELVQDQGLGRLHLEFEALKKALAQEGLFDPGRKKQLPSNPQQIAVITSPSGAALIDFLRLSHNRGLPGQIRIYPCQVQGQEAEETVASALEMADLEHWAQVAVLIRGGGSLEDLWTFNTEIVARTINACSIPVLTGIGHEVDTTIADLVADLRAATPSHAAQLLWPERSGFIQAIDDLETRLFSTWKARLDREEYTVQALHRALGWLSPKRNLLRMQERLLSLSKNLHRLGLGLTRSKEDALLQAGKILMRRGTDPHWQREEDRITLLESKLQTMIHSLVRDKEHQFQDLQTSLSGLDPYRPLRRGYSLVRLESNGAILRRSEQVQPGDMLEITSLEARVKARVERSEDRGLKTEDGGPRTED
ncbi:MAG: exodeoxyribonuclease VII large subunit [Desulfovermiculus sp.]|nr:exodeoxyribonuclease VII large subunit [Desulfovermiculus sp.]